MDVAGKSPTGAAAAEAACPKGVSLPRLSASTVGSTLAPLRCASVTLRGLAPTK